MTKPVQDELEIARERANTLRRRVEQIVTDPGKPRRTKDIELAGVRGMIEQIEQEIATVQSERYRAEIEALRSQLREGDSDSLRRVVDGTLELIEEMTTSRV